MTPMLSKRQLQLLPRSLAAQMVLGVLLALLIAQMLTAIILFDAHRANLYNSAQGQLIKRTTLLAQKLAHSSPLYHQAMVEAASMPRSRYSISLHPLLHRNNRNTLRGIMVRRIEQYLGPEYRNRVLVQISSHEWGKDWSAQQCSGESDNNPLNADNACRPLTNGLENTSSDFIAISIQLPDSAWLNLAAEAPSMKPLAARQTLIFLIIASALVMVAIVFMVRRITRPMRALSMASNRLGRGEHVEPLAESGPADVRRAIRAFNQMNERLDRFVADRTNMIAAITHDLRTPITTMRLRVELLPESNDKESMMATLDEMQQLAEATLSFARESAIKEPSKKVDLDALIDSTCEDLCDIGLAVSYREGPEAISICRPVSLRRALRNLIENAVKYGLRARVAMIRNKTSATITIEDDGPGMAEQDMERVFEPFVRLEHSRSRETGGIGLGMAIARNIIHAHGGEISLSNRPEGGLLITIVLPL